MDWLNILLVEHIMALALAPDAALHMACHVWGQYNTQPAGVWGVLHVVPIPDYPMHWIWYTGMVCVPNVDWSQIQHAGLAQCGHHVE